ncbi:MAG: hypothetical protein Fur0022_45270 [Anaerolineales bacterium]
MPENSLAPIRHILNLAESTNLSLGHENLGFLSSSHGFMPREHPLLALPASHATWDEVAAELPELFRTLRLRKRLEQMPLLPATEDALPDRFLQRASVIFSLFAHAYHYAESTPYPGIPESVQRPWEEISRRLGRPAPHLAFSDMNIYNYRLLDPTDPDPMRMENLQLLIPIVGNEDERRFQCTPTEIVARFTPILNAIVRAQEAVVHENMPALKDELRLIADALQSVTYGAFMKVNPNAHSRLYVDPVVWGKTVAPLATPFQPHNAPPGPSGTAIPTFTLLDVFFARQSYHTTIGHETDRTRQWFPPHWRALLDAAEKISVPAFVQQANDPALTSLFQQALNAYSGETGILGRHRLKAYGYLDLSFKAGRSKTLGGFDGGFSDRLWDRMDDEMERARQERYLRTPQTCHFAHLTYAEDLSTDPNTPVKHLVLDVRGLGLRYQPGDRCAILPENSPSLIEKTLTTLRATGDEPLELDRVWRAAIQLREGYQHAVVLPLRTLLRFGRLRPVSRPTAKLLYTLSHNERLHKIIEARAEEQWELWDLLELVGECGFNPKTLWKTAPGERASLLKLVPPESFRTYSIASAMPIEAREAEDIHLTVGRLDYLTPNGEHTRAQPRTGTGSGFLTDSHTLRLRGATAASQSRGSLQTNPAQPSAQDVSNADNSPARDSIPIKIVHPPRFSLPTDHQTPIVMFAGGTGIAPFRGLIQARAQQNSGENWLFFSTRSRAHFYHQQELEQAVASGRLRLAVVFSREDRKRCDAIMLEQADALWDLIRSQEDGGKGAYVYVCGRTGFAKLVLETLKQIIATRTGSGASALEAAQNILFRMVGEDRYMQEIFTTYAGPVANAQPIDASEVVLHNNPTDGYWMIINGRVYDVTEFGELHPGGMKIIQSYAGMDASIAYHRAQHDINSEVDAMLGMYEIGAVRRLDLGQVWGTAITREGLQTVSLNNLYRVWVRFLYAVVEMENALFNDYSIRTEQVTYNERRGEVSPSPYRTQLLLQTHARFLRDYLGGTAGRWVETVALLNNSTLSGGFAKSKGAGPTFEPAASLETLWALTSGLCNERVSARWMSNRLAEIFATPMAQAALARGAEAQQQLSSGAIPLPELAALTDHLAEADQGYLRDLKRKLREGLKIFERYERDTLEKGGKELLAVAESLPGVVETYFENAIRIQDPPPSTTLDDSRVRT